LLGLGEALDLNRAIEAEQWFGVARHHRPTTPLRTVHDVRRSNIATRRITLLNERANRARLRGVQEINNDTGQTEQDVQAELMAPGISAQARAKAADGIVNTMFSSIAVITKASAYTDCPVEKPTTAVTSKTRPPITKRRGGAEGLPAAGPRREPPQAAVHRTAC
jgi:hypothetical protein